MDSVGGREKNAAVNVEERDSMDSVGDGDAAVEVAPPESSSVVGEEERAALIVKEGDSAAEGSDTPLSGGEANFSGLVGENDSISGHKLEENKEEFMEEETPSHDLLVSEVSGVDCIKSDDKREEGEQVVSGGMAEEESCEGKESELGHNTESGKEKVNVMEDVTTAQAASLVNDIEIPDDNEVASVAGFIEIPSQDKGLDDSVLNTKSEFVEEEPLKELQISEGAQDLTDGDAKEDADVTEDAMDIQVSKKTEEEGKTDGAAVLETETKPQEVDDVATDVSENIVVPVDISSAVVTQFAGETRNDKETVMDDVKEDVEKDPEAGKSVDIQVPEAAEEVVTDVKMVLG